MTCNSPARPGHPSPGKRVSRLSVTVLGAAFLIGIIKGTAAYSQRSHALKRHVPGTNAITVQVALAITAAVAVFAIQAWRSRTPGQPGARRPGPSPWLAPLSGDAVARLGRAIRLPAGVTAVRVVPAALLVLVLLYFPYRMGAQVIGGLDPNSTVNAWGGPTYAGALLAHWLDCLIGFYGAAFLLGRLLPAISGQAGSRAQAPPGAKSGTGPPRP